MDKAKEFKFEVNNLEELDDIVTSVWDLVTDIKTMDVTNDDINNMRYEGYDPILMLSVAQGRHREIVSGGIVKIPGTQIDFDFGVCMRYLAAVFCVRGNKPTKIVLKATPSFKNVFGFLVRSFNILSVSPTENSSFTLARLANALGGFCVRVFMKFGLQGVAPLSPMTCDLPYWIRAPGVSGIVPKKGQFITSKEVKMEMNQDDRVRIFKVALILGCKIDKVINGNRKDHIVDYGKINGYSLIAYENGLMKSAIRAELLISIEVADLNNGILNLKAEQREKIDKLIDENRSIWIDQNFIKFDEDPRIDVMTFKQMKHNSLRAAITKVSEARAAEMDKLAMEREAMNLQFDDKDFKLNFNKVKIKQYITMLKSLLKEFKIEDNNMAPLVNIYDLVGRLLNLKTESSLAASKQVINNVVDFIKMIDGASDGDIMDSVDQLRKAFVNSKDTPNFLAVFDTSYVPPSTSGSVKAKVKADLPISLENLE